MLASTQKQTTISDNEIFSGIVQTELYNIYNPTLTDKYSRTIAFKEYELKDHLGNITAVIEDYKTPVFDLGGVNITAYTAKISSSTNYYPFGMIQPGRNTNPTNYRFGFNGKENDNEVKGIGNSLDFGSRIYDPRIGRCLSLDPLQEKYPNLSPYNFVANNPIFLIDPDGERIFGTNRESKMFIKQYLNEEFGSNRLFRFNINGELIVRKRQFNKFINNPTYPVLTKDIANGIKEAIKRPEIINITVQKNKSDFVFSDIVTDNAGNPIGFGYTVKGAGVTIDPKNAKSIREYHIGIVDSKAQVETYTAETEGKIGKDDIVKRQTETGKSASSVFIHEVLDEFLNYNTLKKTNDLSPQTERTEYQSKSLMNKGLPARSGHDK